MNTRAEINRANGAKSIDSRTKQAAERDRKVRPLIGRDWTYRAIASELGCSVGAVASSAERIYMKWPPRQRHYSKDPRPDVGLPPWLCKSSVMGWDTFTDTPGEVTCEACLFILQNEQAPQPAGRGR